MKRFYLILTCLLGVLAYCEAESAVQAKTRLMAPRVVIKIEDGKAVLSWPSLPGQWYYRVLVSETSDMTAPEILASTADTVYIDSIPSTPGNSSRFYAIVAFRAGNSLDDPEYVIIESFAEPVLLDSYSLEEDLQPDGWQWVEDGAGSEDSISLELFGNTWKRQAIVPKQTVAHEVWQLVIRSLSISRIQAFGIADSANEMWYQIWGTDAVDAESWNASYVGWYPMDEWVVLDLPVAEDWYGRFGYFPCVLEMLYANDNDEMDPPGAFRIDEIRDLSPMIREPQPLAIEWSVAGIPYPDSVDIALSLTGIDEENPPVDYEWTLGDGSLSNDTSFVHRYATNESYRVVLRFRENDGLTGWVTSEIVCGNGSSTREFTFITVGDVMIARRYETEGVIDSIGADGIFDPMRATIQSVDLAMCNLECPFTNWPHRHPTKEYTFKGRPEYLPAIPNAGFDYCALGNNHNLDYMYPGMEETQFLLDSLGMLSSGSGANDLLAREPAIFSKNGLSAAIFSYCNRDGVEDNLQPFLSATRSRPGFALWNRSQI
ncbi:CapA family protein, partial [bacterium]|nr:CapA family protein [bacterium]